MNLRYRYTERSQLVDRCDYMYTPHEGPEFLRAYVSQRENLRSVLRESQPSISAITSNETVIAEEIRHAVSQRLPADVPSGLRERSPEVIPGMPGSREFVTKSLLLDLWQALLHSTQEPVGVLASWIDLLVKKYETQKRLYVAYSAALKPASKKYDQLENYALLASLLMYLYHGERSIKHLNSVLKLIDLLSSVSIIGEGPMTQLTLLGAVEAELEAVKELAADHGIVLCC
ncbi:MAG: hypothetical protein ACREKR_00750 [Candidatus Methylomirabilales bacterium]